MKPAAVWWIVGVTVSHWTIIDQASTQFFRSLLQYSQPLPGYLSLPLLSLGNLCQADELQLLLAGFDMFWTESGYHHFPFPVWIVNLCKFLNNDPVGKKRSKNNSTVLPHSLPTCPARTSVLRRLRPVLLGRCNLALVLHIGVKLPSRVLLSHVSTMEDRTVLGIVKAWVWITFRKLWNQLYCLNAHTNKLVRINYVQTNR